MIEILFNIMPACAVTVKPERLVFPPTAPRKATVLDPALMVREVNPSTVELNAIGLLVEVNVVGATKVTAPPNVIGPVVVIEPPILDVLYTNILFAVITTFEASVRESNIALLKFTVAPCEATKFPRDGQPGQFRLPP